MSIKNLKNRWRELCSYLMAYAPNLPDEDNTTIQEQFRLVKSIVLLTSECVKSHDAQKFLSFCLADLEEATKAFEASDRKLGLKHMESAKRWFDHALNDRPSKASFIAGPNGEVEKL